MISWASHLIILPIIVPLIAGAAMIPVDERNRTQKGVIGFCTSLFLFVLCLVLTQSVAADGTTGTSVYLLGNWPSPFGIVLVLDRLSAMMMLLSSVLALAAQMFSMARWHAMGYHFHSLFMFLMAGLNGAFLTGDLFNLFVFFEMMLAASYGLLLHGSGPMRVKTGLHYIAINLAASSLFLVGVSLIYGATGTLNMAALAVAITDSSPDNRMMLEAGAAILGIAFLVKAGMWPLGFWLPSTYSAASPPAAAIFAVLTKVGIYVLLRLSMLLFAPGAGGSTGFGLPVLLYGGLITIGFATIGVLASQAMGRLAGYAVLVSSGTLLAAIGLGGTAMIGGALFYMVSSTLALCLFFLLIELVERSRDAGADVLAVTMEAYGDADDDEEEKEVGVAVPGTMAALAACFSICAMLIAGLPPLSGFLGKMAMLHGLFNPAGMAAENTVSPSAWIFVALMIFSGLAAMIAMNRIGIRTFWSSLEGTVPRVYLIEITPVLTLLAATLMLAFQAGPAMRYMNATAASLALPSNYIDSVLSAPVAGRVKAQEQQ